MSTQLWFQVIPCYCETVDRVQSVTILKKPHPFSVIQVEENTLEILVSNSEFDFEDYATENKFQGNP